MRNGDDFIIKQKLIQLLTLVNGGITFGYIALIIYAIVKLVGMI